MAITDRKLTAGMTFWAKYKGATYTATLLGTLGEGGEIEVAGIAKHFKTLSGAGAAVRGGKATNGFDFWTTGTPPTEAMPAAPTTSPAPKATGKPRGRKPAPAQPEATEGDPTAESPEALPAALTGEVRCEECGEVFPDYATASQHATDVHPA
jgi:hypothetical protein